MATVVPAWSVMAAVTAPVAMAALDMEPLAMFLVLQPSQNQLSAGNTELDNPNGVHIKLATIMTTAMAIMAGKDSIVATLMQVLTVLQEPGKLLMVLRALALGLMHMVQQVRALTVRNIKLMVQMIGSTVAIAIKLKHLVGQMLLLMEIKVMESTLVATVLLMPVLGLMVRRTNLALELDIKAPKVGETVIQDPILALKVGVAGVPVPGVVPKLVVTLMVIPVMVLIAMVIGPVKVTATLAPILLDIAMEAGALEMLELLMPLLVRMVIF